MRYGRDFYRDRETGFGFDRDEPRAYDQGFRGEWTGYDAGPRRNHGFGFRDMNRYESDYRMNRREDAEHAFRQLPMYDREFNRGYDRDFQRGGYDQSFRAGGRGGQMGGYNPGGWPGFYGQGEINRWTSIGRNPFPGLRTGFATGYGMGKGRFL